MNQFTPYFKEHFYKKLLTPAGSNPVRNRADSFLKIFEILDAMPKDYYRIIETGTMRPDHGNLCFGDDGCSTYIFNDFIEIMGGSFTSVDINPANSSHALMMLAPSSRANIIISDSVEHLWKIPADVKFDLIYLDSYDIVRSNPHPSQLHHIKELCAVIKNTQPGTIICVDDHDAFFTGGQIGKGNYVKSFMKNINAKLIYEGYQIVWQL